MTLKDFHDLASGLQSLAVASAALIGGIWAVVRFKKLLSGRRAEAELALTERTLKQRAIPTIDMSASDAGDREAGRQFIVVDVHIHNRGTRTEVLDPSEMVLHGSKVTSDTDGTTSLRPVGSCKAVNSDPAVVITSHAIEPDSVFRVPFLLPIPSPGVYHLCFRARVSPREWPDLEADHSVLDKGPSVAWWTSAMYYEVKAHPETEKTQQGT